MPLRQAFSSALSARSTAALRVARTYCLIWTTLGLDQPIWRNPTYRSVDQCNDATL